MVRAEEPKSAEDIIRANFLTSKESDSVSYATFRLINSTGQERLRETVGQTKLIPGTTDNRRLVVFDSPADVHGTKTLLIEHAAADDDIWIYLPAMKKVRRLVANDKKDPFVGTDFSYGDVIGHKVEDWNHKLLREERVDGRECYVIESLPKCQEIIDNSGYSKRINWIDRKSFVAVKGEIYDQGGELLKKLSASDIRQVEPNRWQPMRLVAENVQTSHKTVIEFRDFKAGVGVKDDVFAPSYLEK